jgi:release factor glutamine methyltransferase
MSAALALSQAIARLRAAGLEGAAGDARRLLVHAMGIAPDRLTLHLQDPLSPDAVQRFDAMIDARARFQPVAQIIGARDFWGRRFIVTPDVLDPRPETEILVQAALSEPFEHVLDLGTGSGAILLSLLADRPQARGMGVDLSQAALDVAQANAQALGLTPDLRQSDWFSNVAGSFDLIVSNPPYLAECEIAGLTADVRDWEPRMALVPAQDDGTGLTAYRAICAGVVRHLRPGGRLIVEIGPTQGAQVAGLFMAAGLQGVTILPDLDGRARVVAGYLEKLA